MKGSLFGAPIIPNLEVTFWEAKNASRQAKPEESLDIERIRCFSSRHGIQSSRESKNRQCVNSSRNAGDIGTCGFDPAEAIAAAVLLIKSFTPGTAREKEIHLPRKRWRVLTCTKFLETTMASRSFTNFTTLSWGRMKACLAVSKTRPK